MTPRSPKQHHQQQPKTTTISRRLRNRADQNLSVQPPQIPQLRSVRSRRAASFPTPRHNPVNYHISASHSSSLAWETPDLLENIPRSDPSAASTVGGEQSGDLLVAQTLEFPPPYESPRAAQSDLVTCIGAERSRSYPIESAPALHFLPSPLPSVSGGHDFELRLSVDPEQSHDPFLDLQDMSTLGFMMPPSQYGMNHYGSPTTSYSPNYPPQQSYADPRSSNSSSYGAAYAPSSALPHESQSRRPEEHAVLPPYQQPSQSLPRSPYQQQQPLNTMRGSGAPLVSTTHTYTYPAPHNSVPSQSLGSTSAAYPPYVMFNHATEFSLPSQLSQPVYPPVTYGVSDYHPLPTMYPPASAASSVYPAYGSTHDIPAPSTGNVPAVSSSPGSQSSAVMPRILNSRPKPQCWEHGCNGRQFSTFSNLLRHQREKSGTASKSYCPRCNAEFTRTTARNGHMAHDKCKPRRPSDASR